MTNAGCGLKLCTVTNNAMTNTLGHVWAGHPAFNMFGHVPLSIMFGHVNPTPVNQTLSRHDVIWQPTVTIYFDDSCRVWLKTTYCYYK